jgi:hypothetical protein
MCSLTCNRNLACSEGTRQNCCDVITVSGDYDMTIITLDTLYFVLSCHLAPTNALSVQHGQHVDSGATYALTRPHLSSGVDSEAFWDRLLVGFWCEDTCHVGSLDPSSSRDLSVFSALANNRVYKIARFQFRGALANNKHTRIYPGSGPSSEVITLRPIVDINGNKCYKG